jgi:hypothetical protein
MRLGPFRTSATSCLISQAPDDRSVCCIWRNKNFQEKLKYSEETCPSAMLSTTVLTWPDLESISGRHGGKPATYLLSYGAALLPNFLYNRVRFCFKIWQDSDQICYKYINYLKSKIPPIIIWKFFSSTSREAYSVSITKASRLILFRRIITIYFENYLKLTNTPELCGKSAELFNVEAGGTQ